MERNVAGYWGVNPNRNQRYSLRTNYPTVGFPSQPAIICSPTIPGYNWIDLEHCRFSACVGVVARQTLGNLLLVGLCSQLFQLLLAESDIINE